MSTLQVKHPDLKEWLDHKARPWILSGLNINFWKGDKDIFLTIQRNSNLVEATHHQSNSLGTQLSLLGGIYALVFNICLIYIY